MHMIRHDHVSAYGLAMALMRSVPFLHPDSIESPQMLMHRPVVAQIADLGQLKVEPRTGEPRSATRGYNGALPIRNFILIIRIIRAIRGWK